MKSKNANSESIWTLAGMILAIHAVSAQADIIHWTNASGGNWSVAAHWFPNQVPSANDIAVITNSGTYQVTVNVNSTIAGLVVGGGSGAQTLATSGHTLTLNGDGRVNTNGCLLLSGGALSGTNRLALDGTMTWQSGTIDTNTVVLVNAGGEVTLASGVKHAKFLQGNLTNGGVITWRPLGSFYIGGTLHNLAQGVIDAQLDGASILQSTTNAVLVNQGVLCKSDGDRSVDCYVPLCNYGTVDVRSGTLEFLGGSSLNSGSIFMGAGTTRLQTGTHTLHGNIVSTNLVLDGGSLAGHGIFRGTLAWISGQLDETASLTVGMDGILDFGSGVNFAKIVYGNLTNAGTITWRPVGSLILGGTMHNLEGAVFDIQVDNTSILSAGPHAVIINDGLFRRSSGRFGVDCAAPMINNGAMEIPPGKLGFDSSFSNPTGIISMFGGELKVAQPLVLSGGLLTGWGTLSTDVVNAACIHPAPANGGLTIRGNYEQSLDGCLELDLAGNDPGTNQSRLNITGSAILRGTIAVGWDPHFTPLPGAEFPVLTYASREGEFCCLDHTILLGQGRRLEPLYSAHGLTLTTVSAPEPTQVPLRISVDGGALVCWPAEFSDYELYWSTNLNLSSWTLLPGVTNRFLEAPPLAKEKFFLLQKRQRP